MLLTIRDMRTGSRLSLSLLAVTVFAASAAAQDAVTITAGGRTTRVLGRIVEYNGRELQMETPGGQTRNIPAGQVLAVETQSGERQQAAEAARAKGQYAEALALYRQAADAESRGWVRRQIIAQIVRCHRAVGQYDAAGENFLLLVRADPQTPYFDCIPLAWLPRQPAAQVDQAARRWAQRPEPAARLLAVSYLLTTVDGPAAQNALVELSTSDDRRIAQLAGAQTYRAAFATATPEQLQRWQRAIEELPVELQNGPSYVLGRGWLQRQQFDRAAIHLLRPALLEADDRPLAAQALLDAAIALQQGNQTPEAIRLLREVLGCYADDQRIVDEARTRLAALAPNAGPIAAPHIDAAPGDSIEERYFAALRVRGLARLVVAYCGEQLSRTDLPDARRADLVAELSRALAEQAIAAPPTERTALWDRAQQVVAEFVRQFPQNPRLPLVQLQGALGALARGELATQEALLLGGDATRVDDARTQVRTAIRQLTELADAVEQRLRQRHAAPRTEANELTATQLTNLQRTISYELSRAYRNQAHCYARGSDDQTNALLQAAKLLLPLANLDAAEPLRNRSRNDLVVCRRLLADFEGAQQTIDSMMQDKPDAALELRLRAERLRLALAARRPADALKIIDEGRQIAGVTSPELDLAWLETYLALWQTTIAAKQTAEADAWLKKADAVVGSFEMAHGPIWKRRAEMLMASVARAQPGGEDLAMQIRVAENEYRSQRYDEALAAYDRARAAAEKQQNAAKAFELGFTAATIAHQLNRHEQARDRYRQLALAQPREAKAAEAHLLAIGHAAELAKAPAAGGLDQYLALLQEHVQQWKSGPTVDEAYRRLGRIREFQRDWPAALAAYQAVSPGDREYLAAVEAAARCTEAWLKKRQAAGEPTEPVAAEAARWFEAAVTDRQGKLPARFGPVERTAALAAARLWMNYTNNGYGQAQQLLSAALDAAGDAPPQWRSSTELLLVCALAGGGRRQEAAQRLDRAAEGQPEQLLVLVDGLARIAATARPEIRKEIATLQLQTVDLLLPRRGQLTNEARKGLDRLRAQALADAGRNEEALAAFKSLADGDPRDINAQEGYAKQLAAKGDKQSLEASLRKWADLQKTWPQGSEAWLRVQYEIASVQYRLGERKQATQRLKSLEILYGNSGTPELRAEMAELLRKCQQ